MLITSSHIVDDTWLLSRHWAPLPKKNNGPASCCEGRQTSLANIFLPEIACLSKWRNQPGRHHFCKQKLFFLYEINFQLTLWADKWRHCSNWSCRLEQCLVRPQPAKISLPICAFSLLFHCLADQPVQPLVLSLHCYHSSRFSVVRAVCVFSRAGRCETARRSQLFSRCSVSHRCALSSVWLVRLLSALPCRQLSSLHLHQSLLRNYTYGIRRINGVLCCVHSVTTSSIWGDSSHWQWPLLFTQLLFSFVIAPHRTPHHRRHHFDLD